jgi:hypothetical protein
MRNSPHEALECRNRARPRLIADRRHLGTVRSVLTRTRQETPMSSTTSAPIRLAQAMTLFGRTLADPSDARFRVDGFTLDGATLGIAIQLTALDEHGQPVPGRKADLSSLDGWTIC